MMPEPEGRLKDIIGVVLDGGGLARKQASRRLHDANVRFRCRNVRDRASRGNRLHARRRGSYLILGRSAAGDPGCDRGPGIVPGLCKAGP